MDKDTISKISLVAVLICSVAALSWGILGLFDFNLLDFFFHKKSVVSHIVYAIAGISGLVSLVLAWKVKS